MIDHLITDFGDLFFDKDSTERPIMIHLKERRFPVTPSRLKLVKRLLNSNPSMKLVIAQNYGTRLEEADFKEALSTFGIKRNQVGMVDKSLFYGNDEIQKVLQINSYVRSSVRNPSRAKIILLDNNEHYQKRMQYMKNHHEDLIPMVLESISLL